MQNAYVLHRGHAVLHSHADRQKAARAVWAGASAPIPDTRPSLHTPCTKKADMPATHGASQAFKERLGAAAFRVHLVPRAQLD